MPQPREKTTANKAGDGVNTENKSETVTKSTDPVKETEAVKKETEKVQEANTNAKNDAQTDEKDSKIAQLEKQLDEAKDENKSLKGLLKEKDAMIIEQSENALKGTEDPAEENHAEAQVAGKPVKQVKIQFLKDHTFVVGSRTIKGLKGNSTQVDIATANKLAGRGIAVLIN